MKSEWDVLFLNVEKERVGHFLVEKENGDRETDRVMKS